MPDKKKKAVASVANKRPLSPDLKVAFKQAVKDSGMRLSEAGNAVAVKDGKNTTRYHDPVKVARRMATHTNKGKLNPRKKK